MGTPTLPPIPDRVAAGAALLDQHEPGWAAQVDPARLDLASETACVLGQLYQWFGCGVDVLAAGAADRHGWAVAHGFDLDDARPADPTSGAYVPLTSCWRAELARRRGGACP
jgi:hypothetical protein